MKILYGPGASPRSLDYEVIPFSFVRGHLIDWEARCNDGRTKI